MHKKGKFLATCAIMAAMGCVLTAAGIASGGIVNGVQLNSSGLHVYAPLLEKENGQDKYKEKEKELEAFDSIEVNLDYADIRVETSDSGKYNVAYCVEADAGFTCEVTEGRLRIEKKSRPSFGVVDFVWMGFGNNRADNKEEYVTVRIPKNADMSVVDLKAESGNITCEGLLTDRLQATTEYGDVRLIATQIQELDANLDSGEMIMEQATGKGGSIKTEYGDVLLNNVTWTEDLDLRVESGDIRFQDVALRSLMLENLYGSIGAERTVFETMQLSIESADCKFTDTLFDRCNIKAEYGDVQLVLADDVQNYGYQMKTEFGDITIDGEKMGDSFSTLDKEQERMIEIECESGSIYIDES